MDSPGKSLKGKSPINNKQEKEEDQAMDSPGKLLTVKNPVQAPINKTPEKEDGFPTPEGEPFSLQLLVKQNQENQAMDSQGKLFPEKFPVQALEKEDGWTWKVDPHEREGEEEDGFTTPKGVQFRIPPHVDCPPTPPRGGIQQKAIEKRRKRSSPRRLTSVNVQDLNTFFSRTHT
ncbi:hypothetical protein YC2023_022951 [Brassica napus]